jgi:hypothetical protein
LANIQSGLREIFCQTRDHLARHSLASGIIKLAVHRWRPAGRIIRLIGPAILAASETSRATRQARQSGRSQQG